MNRATCWTLTRRDETVLGFTDHDGPLSIGGTVCRPGSGFTPASNDSRLGFGADSAAVQGALDDTRITEADIADGRYSGATLRTYSIDWNTGEQFLERTHRIRSVTRDSKGVFAAELIGITADLDRVSGRSVTRLCSARFGDSDCGLHTEDYPDGTTCPRSYAACKGFSNTINFRGFPHLIGEDALLLGPQPGPPRDGGSRYGNTPGV